MTENKVSTVAVELPSAVEITDQNKHMFDLYAIALGVEVGKAGRKPKAKLVQAILASEEFTLVDTPYLNASMVDGDSGTTTEYGAKRKALIAARDAAIAAAKAEFNKALEALKAEYSVTATPSTSTGKAITVTAITPQLDKEGNVKRNAKGDKVLFRPGPRSVTLTPAQVRELVPDAGTRGRLSDAQSVYAAVVAGKWFPRDLLNNAGWETVLLKDVTVTPVETVEAETAA